MSRRFLKPITVPLLGLSLLLVPTGCDGDDGAAGPAGPAGPPGPPGPAAINASTASGSQLSELDVVSEITGVTIASPPVITFTMKTAEGVPIVGLASFWEADHRFVRFTITKLVEGQSGDPDSWVSYVLDDGEPTYDSGASLVDNEDGSYKFTCNTDVANVAGVTYEPTLTHRVAGQIGNYGMVPLEEQNAWLDFVPAGGAVTRTRNIASVTSCNECHDRLVFHGRRFEVEYCVQCHNPGLADGEGNMSFMIHRIHSAGDFHVLDGGVSYAELTYPQDLMNCRKCHNAEDTATAQADNWRNKPNMQACDGCHDVFGPNASGSHSPAQSNNANCSLCHTSAAIAEVHTTPNSTPNNPELLPGQRKISYEMISAAVNAGTGDVTVEFKILDGTTPLDVTNLPDDLKNSTTGFLFSTPSLLMAFAVPQGPVTVPADYNNTGNGQAASQPRTLALGATSATPPTWGTLAFNAATGVATATVTSATYKFPAGATLRAVALQGYYQQDLDTPRNAVADASLHAVAKVVPVTGDPVRREVVDSAKCANCHEWFEGHGGNRVYTVAVCVTCHVPNLTSSGRTLATNPATPPFPANPLDNPEDSQNMKDMIHGIHSSAFRTRDFEHVRNRSGGLWYNWSEVTFPASTSNCNLCHLEGTYELPLPEGVLPTTVRTTGVANGLDADTAAVTAARTSLPNGTDWVNSAEASSCFYCHTSEAAWAHMTQTGAQLTDPRVSAGLITNRSTVVLPTEACSVCHGPGKTADLEVVHNR